MGKPKFLQRADSILKYATLAFNEAVKIGYRKGTAEAYINKARSAKIKSTGLRISNQDETIAIEEMIDNLVPALKLGQELKNDEIIGDVYSLLGIDPKYKSLIEQVKIDYSIDQSVLYHKAGNEKKEGEACTYMAQGNMFEGYYEKAFGYSQKAISLNQKVLPQAKTKEEQQYRIYLCQQSLADMATLYKEAGDYQSSLEYLNRSVEFGKKYQTGWLWEREKAEIFRLLEQYDSAFAYIKKIKNAPSDNAWNNLIIGQTFLATNNMDSALYFLLETYKSFRDINQMAVFTIPVSIDIAKAYAGKNDFSTAKKYVIDAMALAANSKSRPAQMKGYEVFSKIHYGLGNSDSAYLYLLKHNALKDSIQNRQFLFRINTAKKEALIGLLNKDNKIKEQQLKQQDQLKKFILLSVLALLLIGFFFTRNLLLKKKNEKLRIQKDFELHQLENEKKLTELEMQALRAQMNPHFIFNCLSSINKFILKNEPDTASDYLTRFSRLIRMVLINSKKPLITLEDELDMLTI